MLCISQAALDYLCESFVPWLEAQTVLKEINAGAGSSPPPYLFKMPDPRWSGMRDVAGREWAGLPKGALAGAIKEVARQQAKAFDTLLYNRLAAVSWLIDDIDLEVMQAVVGAKP